MANIQFNLLPDAKAKYIDTERNRRLVNTIAVLAAAISIGIFVLSLFTVDVLQKKELSDADGQSKQAVAQLQKIDGLARIVTVQNQLQTLSSLHQNTHAVSRIFTYMPQLTPSAATIGTMSLDLTVDSLQISGSADSQATINTFIDTLKYATYKTSAQDSDHLAFSSVVLSSFNATPGKATYTITTQFDPVLFANPLGAAPALTVKNQVTTRSVIDDPANLLFNGQPSNTNKSGSK